MARPIDELVVEIKADLSDLQGNLKQLRKDLNTTGQKGKTAMIPLIGSFKGMAGAIGGAAAAFGGFQLGKFVLETGMAFEDLRISLNTVFGSIEKGDQAFQDILNFAKTTPFQIETVANAFISLKSAGIEPSIEQLQIFADAASTTTDQVGVFNTLVRVLQRSVAGGSLQLEELNMISDRGIDVFGQLNKRLGRSRTQISEFGATAQGATKIMEALTEGLEETFGGAMQNKMEALSTKLSNLLISFKTLGVEGFDIASPLIKDSVDRLDLIVTATTLSLRKLRKDIRDTFGPAEAVDPKLFGPFRPEPPKPQATALTTEQTNFLSDLTGILEDAVPELDRLNEQLALTESLRGAIDKEGELLFTDEQIDKALGHLKTLKDDLAETSTFSDEMAQAIQTLSLSFTNEFTDALINGENALDSFKDFSKNMVSQIISIFLQLAVVNQILNSIFGAGTFSTLNLKTGEINPGKLAGGGRIQAGRPTLVGERGAELFIPDSNGVVMNNMNTKNALGGGQPVIVNQSLNFSTGVVPTVRAEVTKMLPQIADVTKGAVLESAMRGGAYARGLRRG